MMGPPYFTSDQEREEDKMNSKKYEEKKDEEKKDEEKKYDVKKEEIDKDENEIDIDEDIAEDINEYIDENEDKCQIIGNGTISFANQNLMKDIIYFCKIQPTVKLQKISSSPNPYICVGQSNLDECKSKISNISSIKDSEWVWYRTIGSYHHHKNTMYVTDNQILELHSTESSFSNDLYLTSNVHLTLLYYDLKDNCLKKYIKVQDKSAKITVIFDNYYYSYEKRNTYIYYHNVPKNFIFEIYFYCESVRLYTLYVNDYQPKSIKLRGKCIIYIREPIHQIKNIFNYNNEIHFVTNTINDYKQICYANQVNECTNLSDFIFTNNYTELFNLELSLRNSFIYLCKDISFDISSWPFKYNNGFVCNPNKFSISCYLPNNTRVLFDSSSITICSNNKVYYFLLKSDNVDFTFDIKRVTTLDYSRNLYITKSFKLTSSEKVVEIIASPSIRKMNHIYISGDFEIKSTVPQYLNKLIGSNACKQLSSWTYLYLSEEGKSLYESYPASNINNINDDENISEKVVLAVGKNDNISIPSSWKKNHSLYILQENNNAWGNQISSLNYLIDGLIINDQIKIIYGDITINPLKSFYINAKIDSEYSFGEILYYANVNCSYISKTLMEIQSIFNRSRYYVHVINYLNSCSKNESVIKNKESDF